MRSTLDGLGRLIQCKEHASESGLWGVSISVQLMLMIEKPVSAQT
jgi:hypothetical protein